MKVADRAFSVMAMFCMIMILLITSFQLAIYGDSEYRFYEKEYLKYNVTESLDMEIEDVMEVTDYMMAYLIGEEEELSIVTDVDGREQDFFNEQDRLHMEDVKNLFLGGLKIRTVLIVIMILLLVPMIIQKAELGKLLPKAYSQAFAVFIVILAALGVAFAMDFTTCFTIFHEIFFTNDLWLFDPRTDYMIRMLPEGFFADMVVRILKIFVVFLLAVFGIMRIWKKRKNEK